MIFLFILYSLLRGVVIAIPLPLSPEDLSCPVEADYGKFTQRTEWNIICSCFATLFACSWVAIHLNIPDPSDSSMRTFSRRLMIMGYMLIAPEMVIIWAARQWCAAHYIAKKHKQRGREWTTTHGFFVSMGGFMLYEGDSMRQTLTITVLEQLESEGKIDWPTISKDEIRDKSKGNFISKGFVVLQSTWFITQCIARGVAGLSLTELELATLAFAALNGILYFLWWDKPLDVAYPILVHLHHSTTSGGEIRSTGFEGTAADDVFPSNTSRISLLARSSDEETSHDDIQLSVKSGVESARLEPSSSTPPQSFPPLRNYLRSKFGHMRLFNLISSLIIKPFIIVSFPVIKMANCKTVDSHRPFCVPTFYAPDTPGQKHVGLIGVGVGTLFGGIHCIAWSFTFQSVEDRSIWRICAVTITIVPIAMFAGLALRPPEEAAGYIRYIRFFLAYITVLVCLMGYAVSRTILLILPLIALLSLNPESLLDINWSALIPHV